MGFQWYRIVILSVWPWTTKLHKMMHNAFRCWNLCFRIIVWWCFNLVYTTTDNLRVLDTTHLFLWEKIAPFGCGVMTRLWRQTTAFGVFCHNLCTFRWGILLTLKSWLKIWFLMIKDTHCFQQNSIVRDEKVCFPVKWNCWRNILYVSWTV